MKTKLVILLGVTLSVVSVFAVAQNLFTPTGSTEVPQGQVSVWATAATDDVSALLLSLQGIPAEESAYLDDDKAIYISRPNDLNEKTSRRKIVENVGFLFDQRGSKILFAKKVNEAGEENGWSTDLWLLNTLSGQETKVSDSVRNATLSPSGEFIVAEDPITGGVNLFNGEGVFIKNIGIYGVGAVFSPDNTLLAYTKLAKFTSSPFDMGAPGNILGVFVYNIETGDESVVINDERDSGPIAFSSDNRKLYFDSSRVSGDLSLWVAYLASLQVKQLTNKGHIPGTAFTEPRVFSNPIFSSDERVIVSSWRGEGVGVLVLDARGEVLSSKKIKNGTDPRWLGKDNIIAYRATGTKGKYWEFVSVK